MKISSLTPGQVAWTVTKQKMGNTTVSTVAIHPVRVISVHDDYVVASWNGNAERKFYEKAVKAWRKSKPVTIQSRFSGAKRLATRAEIKELLAFETNKNRTEFIR